MPCYLNVHVTPKSGVNALCGIETPASESSNYEIKVRVTAPPENGKATKAVCKVVADAVGIPKSAVRVVSGDTSRHKRLMLECSEDQLNVFLPKQTG